MKLFEILPERFFNLFVGKNRIIYSEATLLLFEQYQLNRFGIEYEVMRDLFQELIETQAEFGIDYELEDESEQVESTSLEFDVFRTKANAILRRMRDHKWIEIEPRDNFRQYIVLPHYSSRILAVLKELCEDRTVEYQRFAFVTYQLLTGDEAKLRPSFALLEAEKMTEQFINELTLLVNNMKHHMEQVASKDSIQEVLDHHFDEYKAKIVDRSYHRLKTSDHVSRYRQQILDTVQTWLLDKDMFIKAVEDGLKSEFFPTSEEAEEKVRKALLAIEEVYRSLDEVFYEIDLRHNQYLRASFDRARYLSQHSQGVDHQIAEILEWFARRRIKSDILFEPGSSVFRLMRVSQVIEQSLFAPRQKRLPHQPPLHVNVPISDELKNKLREQNLERLRRSITREKVKSYVLDRMGRREEMGIEELVPATVEELLYLSYVYLYGYDGTAGYLLVPGEQRILHIGDYRFNDRRIVRQREEQKLAKQHK